MDSALESDAAILWDDVLERLSQKNLPASTLAMLKSCQATSMDSTSFHLAASSRFVQRAIGRQAAVIESCIEEIAFQHLSLVVDFSQESDQRPIVTNSELSSSEVAQWNAATTRPSPAPAMPPAAPAPAASAPQAPEPAAAPRGANPLVEEITENDSKLTFDRFVEGPQNKFAFDAAKQVANGENKNYNPQFINGKSGLGKTHLLRAIQNYIAQNDPSRVCVYRVATDFIDDYTKAMRNARSSAPGALAENYHNIDVLIIDDIQLMSTAAGTINFFFDTFNYLIAHGKQIVMAADRTPSELGMEGSRFDERVTSRIDSGMTVAIQVPDYELKLELIDTFYERMRQDARTEHIYGLDARIPSDLRKLMAERAGDNIRVIEGFVQSCLMLAFQRQQQGEEISREDILRSANQKWPTGQKLVTVEQIQEIVEREYGISHEDLVGSKRNKELMEPRHIAIWLTRELTDNTLADIGKKFGGRTHATVKHSIRVIEDAKKDNRTLTERVERIKGEITDS